MDLEARFREQVQASIATKQALLGDPGQCLAVAQVLIEAYQRGGQLFLFGNGGSAADAQHIAAEFLGRFYLERSSLAAHALTVNTSVLTAIANDYSFDYVYARQLEGLGRRATSPWAFPPAAMRQASFTDCCEPTAWA
jgi:D-sedoheptulose 7-phosphate isomerase